MTAADPARLTLPPEAELADIIREAVNDHNDVDGVFWTGVARDVAQAVGAAALLMAAPAGEAGLREALRACTKEEMAAFEAWAAAQRYDMGEHPLHYIFLDPKTNAARMGWKAGLAFAREIVAANQPAAQEPPSAGVGKERISELLAEYGGYDADCPLGRVYGTAKIGEFSAILRAALTPADPKTPDAATGGSVGGGGLREAIEDAIRGETYTQSPDVFEVRGIEEAATAVLALLPSLPQPAPVGEDETGVREAALRMALEDAEQAAEMRDRGTPDQSSACARAIARDIRSIRLAALAPQPPKPERPDPFAQAGACQTDEEASNEAYRARHAYATPQPPKAETPAGVGDSPASEQMVMAAYDHWRQAKPPGLFAGPKAEIEWVEGIINAALSVRASKPNSAHVNTPRPAGNNADEWNAWLDEHRGYGTAYIAVQISQALEDVALSAAPAARPGDEFVLVPREPTPEMIEAGRCSLVMTEGYVDKSKRLAPAWRHMIAAAPAADGGRA